MTCTLANVPVRVPCMQYAACELDDVVYVPISRMNSRTKAYCCPIIKQQLCPAGIAGFSGFEGNLAVAGITGFLAAFLAFQVHSSRTVASVSFDHQNNMLTLSFLSWLNGISHAMHVFVRFSGTPSRLSGTNPAQHLASCCHWSKFDHARHRPSDAYCDP